MINCFSRDKRRSIKRLCLKIVALLVGFLRLITMHMNISPIAALKPFRGALHLVHILFHYRFEKLARNCKLHSTSKEFILCIKSSGLCDNFDVNHDRGLNRLFYQSKLSIIQQHGKSYNCTCGDGYAVERDESTEDTTLYLIVLLWFLPTFTTAVLSFFDQSAIMCLLTVVDF